MARGVPAQDALARTPLWLAMMKAFLSENGRRDPKQADRNASGQLSLFPQQSDYPANEGWRWQKDIQAWADSHNVLLPMRFKHQKQNPPNPPGQDSLNPRMPGKQTQRQPTPGLSGTRWSEDLFREPSQHNEPPIPGVSQPSKPHEDASNCEPEPEAARCNPWRNLFVSTIFSCFPLPNFPSPLLQQSRACPATPTLVIIIENMPVGSAPAPPLLPHKPWCQAPLIPTMRLARNLPTYD
ncbi:hypothetical protein O181_057884 [Austropuccinia psidii MF-1]|uniref:Uncharacterized protein n=1 Tax=Austropuccinia psidii MF-1 TaxID=1389203 RepID=A0A9Q3HX37_9BASI|nr:hypothetical protein [Austropuccinia psidii MF-1]